jgi:hypothetical protein
MKAVVAFGRAARCFYCFHFALEERKTKTEAYNLLPHAKNQSE